MDHVDGNLAMNSHFENTSEKDENYMADYYIKTEEGNRIIGAFGEIKYGGYVEYHESWDLLMPVVEQISKIEFERRYDEDLQKWVIWTHHPVTFGMLDEQGRPMVRFYCSALHAGDTLIQATWNAVVGFIKSYKP